MNWIERRRRLHRRRRVLRFLLVGTAGTAVLGLAGLVLPQETIRSGTLTLSRSRESIWRILTDLDGMPRWRSDLTGLERLPDQDGRPVWRETRRGSARVVQLSLAEPPRRLEMRPLAGYGGDDRTIELEEARGGTGTLVRVTERHPVAPLGRLFARLGHLGGSAPVFLEDLARWLGGERPQIAHTP